MVMVFTIIKIVVFKLESTQYAAALAVSGTWRRNNTDKLFEELGWESLAHARWYRRLCLFYKIMNNGTPAYTRRYLPTFKQNPYDLRRPSIFAEERTNTNRYSNSFYTCCIKAWNNLDPTIGNLPDISQFTATVNKAKKRHLFGINDRVGVNLLTRLRVDFSDLKLHKFDHKFNCDSPLSSCGQSSESTVHFFLHCQLYTDLRRVLLDSVSEIILTDVRVYPDQHMCHILLYGSESFNRAANRMT